MYKTKTIFSMKVAAQLVRRGHEILVRTPNINDLRYDVFKFRDSDMFRKDLDEIMAELRQQS